MTRQGHGVAFLASLLLFSLGLPCIVSPCFAQGPAPAAAPSSSSVEEAKRRYGQGVKFYEDGDFRLAAIEFEKAYDLSKSYKILYNIGQVQLQLGSYARAYDALERYLKEGGSDVPPARRRDVERDIATCRDRTARLTVEANSAGADVSVDDVSVGTTPLAKPLRLDVGRHRVMVTKEKRVPATQTVQLAPTEEAKLSFTLKEEIKASVIVVNNEASLPPRRPYAWIGWPIAAIFAVGAVTAGAISINSQHDLRDLRATPNASRTELDSTASDAKRAALVTDILGAAAVVTVGATLYLTLTARHGKEASPTPAAPPPPSLALRGGFGRVALQGTF